MPIFMDLHIVPGISAKDAAQAHWEDLKIQDEYGCRCMTYWVDEDRGCAFCLIDAPSKHAVKEMHEKAHGLIPHEIIQVNSNVIEAFLGRIQDPKIFHSLGDNKLKIFNDPAFRVIMVCSIDDKKILQVTLGKEKANKLTDLFLNIFQNNIRKSEGKVAELRGEDFTGSFLSVSQAVQCAITIQNSLHIAADFLKLRIGIHAGLPVIKGDTFFGEAVKIARYLYLTARENQIVLSSLTKELYRYDWNILVENSNVKGMNPSQENFLELLFDILHNNWQDNSFGVERLVEELGMSKSQVFRKCKKLTLLSPNSLIRDFRLFKSLSLLRSGKNISQTAFDSGFTSSSYYSKCFQNRYGFPPHTYQKEE